RARTLRLPPDQMWNHRSIVDVAGRETHIREPHHVCFAIDCDAVALPIGQRVTMRRKLDVEHAGDHDRMGMPLDDLLRLAFDRRERADQQPCTGGARRPSRTGKPLGPLQPALAGKSLRNLLLFTIEDVDAEIAVLLQDDDERLTLTISGGGSTDSD